MIRLWKLLKYLCRCGKRDSISFGTAQRVFKLGIIIKLETNACHTSVQQQRDENEWQRTEHQSLGLFVDDTPSASPLGRLKREFVYCFSWLERGTTKLINENRIECEIGNLVPESGSIQSMLQRRMRHWAERNSTTRGFPGASVSCPVSIRAHVQVLRMFHDAGELPGNSGTSKQLSGQSFLAHPDARFRHRTANFLRGAVDVRPV